MTLTHYGRRGIGRGHRARRRLVHGNDHGVDHLGDETITAHDGLLSNPQTLHETALEQTITFDQPADHTYGDAPFASGATSDSGLTVEPVEHHPDRL